MRKGRRSHTQPVTCLANDLGSFGISGLRIAHQGSKGCTMLATLAGILLPE
jgi:hypothetical protein